MMRIYTKSLIPGLLVVLFLTSCGDKGTGVDAGEPPDTPSLEAAQPDVSFFKNNSPQKASGDEIQETTHFYSAKNTVISASWFFAIGQIYSSLFNDVNYDEAEFNNGTWEWSYTSSYQHLMAEYVLTATEKASSTTWAMSWSWDNGESKVTDYTIMEGTIADDESEGNWTFNSLDTDTNQEVTYLKSSWKQTSNTKKDLTLEVFDETGAIITTVTFSVDASVYRLVFSYEGKSDVIVIWNSETNIGSITQDGTKQCWNENFQDVTCS